MIGFDPLYFLFMAPALVLSLVASIMVKSKFNKYAKVSTRTGMSGAEAAEAVMRAGGVYDVKIERVSGFMSDHYDPTHKVLRLSPDVYDGRTISAVGVGAHEAGHAIQHKAKYSMLMARTAMVPIASIGSNLSWIILIAGFMLNALNLIYVGIFLFAGVVIFQLVTGTTVSLAARKPGTKSVIRSRPDHGVCSPRRCRVQAARAVSLRAWPASSARRRPSGTGSRGSTLGVTS